MRLLTILLFLGLFTKDCSKQEKQSVFERTYNFKISECQKGCGIDSIGIRKNEIKNDDLLIRLGYIVNCSWEQGSLKHIELRKDTLLIELDRPHDIDTLRIDSLKFEIVKTYPLTDCDCFFYFDFKINDITQKPKVIRVSSTFQRENYWDKLTNGYFETEESIIESN